MNCRAGIDRARKMENEAARARQIMDHAKRVFLVNHEIERAALGLRSGSI